MLHITRLRKGQVDERDLSEVVKNTPILLKKNYKNEQVRKMYNPYENLWMLFVAKENIKTEYDNVKLVKFFFTIKAQVLTKYTTGDILMHQFKIH